MTEAEWAGCTDPDLMLSFLRDSGRGSERKFRLFVVACCRLVKCLPQVPGCPEALNVAEACADKRATLRELQRACANVSPAHRRPAAVWLTEAVSGLAPWQGSGEAPGHAARARREEAGGEGWWLALREQAVVLRDIFNPFRPVPLDAAWRTLDVLALAHAAYEERHLPSGHLDPACLSVLCDALEDAGCPPDAELLGHLRSPGPHVRGCWGVDAVLGRS
jgi:hypothetical protein